MASHAQSTSTIKEKIAAAFSGPLILGSSFSGDIHRSSNSLHQFDARNPNLEAIQEPAGAEVLPAHYRIFSGLGATVTYC